MIYARCLIRAVALCQTLGLAAVSREVMPRCVLPAHLQLSAGWLPQRATRCTQSPWKGRAGCRPPRGDALDQRELCPLRLVSAQLRCHRLRASLLTLLGRFVELLAVSLVNDTLHRAASHALVPRAALLQDGLAEHHGREGVDHGIAGAARVRHLGYF